MTADATDQTVACWNATLDALNRHDERHDEADQATMTANTAGVAVTPSRYVRSVPRISAFYGIVIAMYFGDHPPPHFHAKYGEYEAQFAIATGEVLHGVLPRRARALVEEWTELHRDELMQDWERAARQEPLHRIEPLP